MEGTFMGNLGFWGTVGISVVVGMLITVGGVMLFSKFKTPKTATTLPLQRDV